MTARRDPLEVVDSEVVLLTVRDRLPRLEPLLLELRARLLREMGEGR